MRARADGDGARRRRVPPMVAAAVGALALTGAGCSGGSSPSTPAKPGVAGVVAKPPSAVLAWGANDEGQLGAATPGHASSTPTPVSGLADATAIAAGGDFAVVVTADGSPLAWGASGRGQLGTTATSGAASPSSGCALQPCRATAAPLSTSAHTTAVAAGGSHGLALLTGGSVLTWGDNTFGELGNGSYGDHSDGPVAVRGLSGVRAIAAGDDFDIALLSDGTVVSWGQSAELGRPIRSSGATTCLGGACSNVPKPVSGLSDVVAIAAGATHTLALRADGIVMAWGVNDFGQLGQGSFGGNHRTPAPVKHLAGVSAIAAGSGFSLALRSGGTVVAWGRGDVGQLGTGSAGGSDVPVAVRGVHHVHTLAGGGDHGLALDADGTVMAWGGDHSGELGVPATSSALVTCPGRVPCALTPLPVPGLTGVRAIAAGGDNAAAGFSLARP